MKKRNAIIYGWLIAGILLSCAANAAAQQTIWMYCYIDKSASVPQKGRENKREGRFYVTELLPVSRQQFTALNSGGKSAKDYCFDYFDKTVGKAADGQGIVLKDSGLADVVTNGSIYGTGTMSKEELEKDRAERIAGSEAPNRKTYVFNWDPAGKNVAADLQREMNGVAPTNQTSDDSNAAQFKNTSNTSGDVKDRISSLIALPANQIPLAKPKMLVVNGLKEDANYVLRAENPADFLKKNEIDDYDYKNAKAIQERAESGLQKLKMLFEAGTPDTETIDLVTGKLKLGELAEMLLDINRNAVYVGMINKLEQTAMRTKIWVEDVGIKGKLNYDQLEQAALEGEKLEKLVVEAQRVGFPDDFKLNFQNQDYTLSDLKEMGHYVATAGGQLKAEIEAARAAKDQPYLKVLTGDKARIFKEEFGGQGGMWEAYGSGGKILNSPAAMSGASVWFTYGNSRGIVDTWHVTGWRFQGDKLVGRISRSGYGLKPPAGAYR